MRRFIIALAVLISLCVVSVLAHCALIESGEVIVLRTQQPDGGPLETRLWIVDDGAVSWLHGDDSRWVHNLEARPIVEIVRGGEARRYRATPVPGPHPEVHELLRAKYGVADRWVRFLGPDTATTRPIRLEKLAPP